MGKVKSKIINLNGEYYIKIEKQLMDYLGFSEQDEIEFEPKKLFEINRENIDNRNEVKVKIVDTCFKYGVATLSTKDRHLFPNDRHPFVLEIDNKDYVKHVASLKIAMKDFFGSHQGLKEKEYIKIKILEPLERYKLVY
jgi:hypothetical protein